LGTHESAPLTPDQPVELRIQGEAVTIGELP
jgi:hypothetical protein